MGRKYEGPLASSLYVTAKYGKSEEKCQITFHGGGGTHAISWGLETQLTVSPRWHLNQILRQKSADQTAPQLAQTTRPPTTAGQ